MPVGMRSPHPERRGIASQPSHHLQGSEKGNQEVTQTEMRTVRRGNPNNSGKLCDYHDDDMAICSRYGRFQLAGMETQQGQEFVSCGQHLTYFIRKIWFNSFSAAIIQE